MVRIRLTRMGKRNRAFFRIGVYDAKTRRDGRTIEQLGFYDPFATDIGSGIKLDVERANYWISVGAQPSEKVGVLLKKAGAAWPRKKAAKKTKGKKAKTAAKKS